jgi:hypothetical protein
MFFFCFVVSCLFIYLFVCFLGIPFLHILSCLTNVMSILCNVNSTFLKIRIIMNLNSQLLIQRKYLLQVVCGLVCVSLWVVGFRGISVPRSIYMHTHVHACTRMLCGVYVIVSLVLGLWWALLDTLAEIWQFEECIRFGVLCGETAVIKGYLYYFAVQITGFRYIKYTIGILRAHSMKRCNYFPIVRSWKVWIWLRVGQMFIRWVNGCRN